MHIVDEFMLFPIPSLSTGCVVFLFASQSRLQAQVGILSLFVVIVESSSFSSSNPRLLRVAVVVGSSIRRCRPFTPKPMETPRAAVATVKSQIRLGFVPPSTGSRLRTIDSGDGRDSVPSSTIPLPSASHPPRDNLIYPDKTRTVAMWSILFSHQYFPTCLLCFVFIFVN